MADFRKQTTKVVRETKAAREAKILATASKVFKRKGYANTSMGDIGKAVGLLQGSLYYYFKSKDEILYKIVSPPIERLISTLQAIVASEVTPTEKLHAAILAHVGGFEETYPEMLLFIQEDFKDVRPALRTAVVNFRRTYDAIWDGLYREGIEAGEFRADLDRQITVYGILGMCNWMHRWFTKGKRLTGAEIAEIFTAIITSGIVLHPAVAPGASHSLPVEQAGGVQNAGRAAEEMLSGASN